MIVKPLVEPFGGFNQSIDQTFMVHMRTNLEGPNVALSTMGGS